MKQADVNLVNAQVAQWVEHPALAGRSPVRAPLN